MVGKFARRAVAHHRLLLSTPRVHSRVQANLPTLRPKFLDSLCQTANAPPPVWPLPAFKARGPAPPFCLPRKRERSAEKALSAGASRTLAWVRATPKDACEASPCPLRSGHSPFGAPLRPLRLHRPFSSRGRPSASYQPARGSRACLRRRLVSGD